MTKFRNFLRTCFHILLYLTFGSIFLAGLLRVGMLIFSDSRTYQIVIIG